MSAFLGTFVNLKTMSDGTVRISLDLDCTLADFSALGLMPGTPFGIARITGESTIAKQEPEPEPKSKPGELCIMACTFCKDPLFYKWLEAMGNPMAYGVENSRDCILEICEISSRKELDTNNKAAELFHNHIRIPFLAWKN